MMYNLMGHFGANSHTCQFAQKQGSEFNDFSIKKIHSFNILYAKITEE